MNWRIASSLLMISLVIGPQVASGQQSQRFDPKSYPAESFHVSRHDYPIGDITVRIIQVVAAEDACRAWLEVRERGSVVRQVYFKDVDAVGGYYGIFLPNHQPFDDFFVALKFGDYDGRLLIVGKDGSLTNLPGGDFFLTPDKRYLIGSHNSDYQSPFVIEVARRRIVIDGAKEKLPGVGDWYVDGAGYFFTEDDESGELQNPDQKTVTIYRLDLKSMKFSRGVMTKARLKTTSKMEGIPFNKALECGTTP
jgi:hypothetical protein